MDGEFCKFFAPLETVKDSLSGEATTSQQCDELLVCFTVVEYDGEVPLFCNINL